MQEREDGYVAIKYYTTVPHKATVRNVEYYFIVRANINLSWIRKEHVDLVLNLHRKSGCCGGNRSQEYFLANESDVRRWTNNGGS